MNMKIQLIFSIKKYMTVDKDISLTNFLVENLYKKC